MPPDSATGLQQTWAQVRGFLFPLLIVTSILVIIAPLPPLIMDMLLAKKRAGDRKSWLESKGNLAEVLV